MNLRIIKEKTCLFNDVIALKNAPDRLEFVLRKLYQLQTIRIHIGRTKANKFPLAER